MSAVTFPLLGIARLRMGSDGSGVTSLVAGAGCPLRCEWCINKKLLRDAPAENVTAGKLLDRVIADDLYYQATGGGITFGGGEPLLPADLIGEFRQICPSYWKITAETSLFVPRNYLAAVTDAVDLFIVDCKDMNEEIYRKYTGEDASVMKENLDFLLSRKGCESVLVRVPLIPGYNTAEDRQRSVKELESMGVQRLDLFEYVVKK